MIHLLNYIFCNITKCRPQKRPLLKQFSHNVQKVIIALILQLITTHAATDWHISKKILSQIYLVDI